MPTKAVGIRLDEDDMQALESQAKSLGLPAGTLARQLVVAALKGGGAAPATPPEPKARPTPAPAAPQVPPEVRALVAETQALRAEVQGIRRNMWNLALALLILQKPLTAAQANQWAKDNLTK
jgi:hypothetical protein